LTARIQLRRTKGWRKPADAVVVARPSRWGNPFKLDGHTTAEQVVDLYRRHLAEPSMSSFRAEIRSALHGRDLACWCPLDQPCHADVLLEFANVASEAP
jgi:Domain of unknown function (DUF4326)